jgi:ligand-binding SRPBCC domain-containing protein
MKAYSLTRKQFLPISLQEAWDFFSSPKNLSLITPSKLKFRIVHISSGSDKMHAGQFIRYKITVFPFVRVDWLTEITHVKEPLEFIDEQRSGPYSLWHHRHHFQAVEGGVEMTDEVTYAVPFGWLGQVVHWIFVAREVNTIFDYRYRVLEKHF